MRPTSALRGQHVNQRIYRWRGGSDAILLTFSKRDTYRWAGQRRGARSRG